jgi:hypothetical protein
MKPRLLRAEQLVGDAVGQAGRAVLVAEQPLDDQREAECQQQAVEVVELVQAASKKRSMITPVAPTSTGAMASDHQ